MRTRGHLFSVAIIMTLGFAGVTASGPKSPVLAQANPCAAGNPCGAKNPCAAAAKIDPKLVTRPADTRLASGNRQALIREGERLWKSTKLSTNGVACQTCHQGSAAFKSTFAKPYPHAVAMVSEKVGVEQVSLDEMIQVCMIVPMASRPLPWDSKELAALTAYAAEVQRQFKPGAPR